MALSPDGTTLAVGGERLHLFDLAQDSDPQVSTHNVAAVSSLAFSPDGALLAAAHTDSTITLWHDRRSAPWLLKGHSFPVTALTFSPDGMTLASASAADGVKVWSTVDPPGNWPVQSMPHDGIGKSPTAGDWMLWWTRDQHIEARNIAVPGVPPIRRQLPFPVNGRVYLSPRAQWLCFADPEGNLGIWETQSLKPILTLPIAGLELPAFCFSPDETKLATFDPTTRTRIIWQIPDGRELARQGFDGLQEAWRAWWGSDSRSYLVADAQSRGLWIWDVADNVVRTLLPHATSIWRALMSDDHTLIATVDALGRVTLWDTRTYRKLQSFPERGPVGYNTYYLLDLSSDNRRLAVLNPRREVRLYDVATGQEITAIAMPDIVGVGFSPDDQWLVLGTVDQFHFRFHYLPSAPLD